MLLTAVAIGLVIGLSLGALGGGGSVLTVPALVYILELSPQKATTASLVIVGITAAASSIRHARSGHTRWGAGALLAAVGVPASLLGTVLNRRVDPDVLLLSFAALMLVAAVGMLVRSRTSRDALTAKGEPGRAGGAVGTLTATRQHQRVTPTTRSRGRSGRALRLASAGLGIGFLTGFLGVGGGFVVVPVLVVLFRTPMPIAVGTSLLVISLNSAVALAARVGSGGFDWSVIVPFTTAAVAGSLAGERVADRISANKLTVAFAALLVAVAAYVAVQALLGLT